MEHNTLKESENNLKRKIVGETTNMIVKKKFDNVLTELNTVHLKQAVNLKELQIGLEYHILSARKVTTKYSEQIMLELEDNMIFLPKRYKTMSKETLDGLNTEKYVVKVVKACGKTFDMAFGYYYTEIQDTDFRDIDVDSEDIIIPASQTFNTALFLDK